MGQHKEEDLYCNFSRKDLQGLCKKYGLPANKSNSEMATSLILYLEASADDGNLTMLHKESNSGAGIQENTFSSVVSSSAVAPSPTFTYDVYCEDGIQLYVDLNSNPSDWVENLKAGVHICHHVQKAISQSFHQDIELLCSSKKKYDCVIMDPSKETDHGQVEVGSYPFAVVADIQGQTEEPDGLKVLSNDFNVLDNSEKEQTILSSKLEYGTQGKLPGIASSIRDEKWAVDSGLNVVVQPGSRCDFEGNSVPSDPKCSGFPVHQGGAIPGNSSIHENTSLQQTYGLLDAVLECGEASTPTCTEMQTSTCATLSNGFKMSPSGVHRDVNLTKQLNNSEPVESILTPVRDELQSLLVQAVDQRKFISSTPVIKVEPQQGIPSFSRKIDGQIRETETQAEIAGSPRTQECNRGTDSEQGKDATLHSHSNGGLFDLAVPAQKGGDHCSSSKSIEDDICRIPSAADVGKLDTRDPSKGSEELKCLSYNCKGQLGIHCERPASSESSGVRKRKRLTDGAEGQSTYANSGGKILRSSKRFVRDDQSKRRRSSRLFTK